MKYFFKVLGSLGFISMLLGMGMMDSASVVLPITMIFAGIATFYYGMKKVDEYA